MSDCRDRARKEGHLRYPLRDRQGRTDHNRDAEQGTAPLQGQGLVLPLALGGGTGIKGTWDYELAAVYGVFFLNFTLDEENRPNNNRNEGKFRRDIVLADRENGQVFNLSSARSILSFPDSTKRRKNARPILNVGFMY